MAVMAFGDNDLGVFFGDFGVPVQFGGQTVNGILDEPQAVHLGDQGWGGISAVAPTLRLPSNAFTPMPEEMDMIVVNWRNYEVTEVTGDGDGAISVFHLKGPLA